MPSLTRRSALPLSLAVCLAAGLAAPTAHAEPAYDEAADARQDIQQALAQAAVAKVPVLIVFGANWCPDCRVLDLSLKSGAAAPLIARDFRVVKVNVGRFDRNVDLAASYGVPLKKGIPAVAVVSPDGKLLFSTSGGELADARSMGEQGIYAFFKRVGEQTQASSKQ
jgi:protein disulfide-isomerase